MTLANPHSLVNWPSPTEKDHFWHAHNYSAWWTVWVWAHNPEPRDIRIQFPKRSLARQ